MRETRKQIPGSDRIAYATGDGGAGAAAQRERPDDRAVTSANQQFGNVRNQLSSLTDADLVKEAAQLRALQARQLLATQALPLVQRAPQTLLSLFR